MFDCDFWVLVSIVNVYLELDLYCIFFLNFQTICANMQKGKMVPTRKFSSVFPNANNFKEERTYRICLCPADEALNGVGDPCPPGLECRETQHAGQGLFVCSGYTLPAHTVLGAVEGEEFTADYIDELREKRRHKRANQVLAYAYTIDVKDRKGQVVDSRMITQVDRGNFVRKANHREEGTPECNLELISGCYQKGGNENERQLFLVSTREIKENEECCWDYGDLYYKSWDPECVRQRKNALQRERYARKKAALKSEC